VAPGRIRRPYLPEELAFAVVCVSQGQSLSAVAAELGRDRSGLLRTLKSLGYPTAPERLDPARRRADTLQRIESLKPLSRDEIKQRILQLRLEAGTRKTGTATIEVWTQPRLASCSNIPADARSGKSADR
jgi:hypothetical protein